MVDLTYAEVGATADDVLPSGYHHLRVSRAVGRGDAAFADACETLMTWGMHRRAGLRFVSGPSRVAVGADVTLRFLGQSVPCRVVTVVDEPDRQGFAYGTLAGHPEDGEERFVVERDPATGEVTAHIVAFSRPGTWKTRVIGPAGRLLQQVMTKRYLAALVPR